MEKLIAQALTASQQAFAPYSHYVVGVALETNQGEIYGGCNIEAATYSATNHAEEVAIVSAIVNGAISQNNNQPKFIKQLAVVTKDASPCCGICLQRISEHAEPDCAIICADLKGENIKQYKLKDLLPHGFSLK